MEIKKKRDQATLKYTLDSIKTYEQKINKYGKEKS